MENRSPARLAAVLSTYDAPGENERTKAERHTLVISITISVFDGSDEQNWRAQCLAEGLANLAARDLSHNWIDAIELLHPGLATSLVAAVVPGPIGAKKP